MNRIANTITCHLGRLVGSIGLLMFATFGTALADNVSKTFEFGAGTPQPRSHVRTFPIPCGTTGGVAAVVKFQRLGPDGSANNLPIFIDLREPDTATDVEGPLVETKSATATRTEQTLILRSQPSNRGCSLPWRVRVRYANEGTAPVQVFGTIRLDFDGRSRRIAIDDLFDIAKGSSVTKSIGGAEGFEQGIIDVRAQWFHTVVGIASLGTNTQIKLKWQLIDPSGSIVKTVEAYSNEDSSPSPRHVFTYQVTKHTPGQWKFKITNTNTNDDARVRDYIFQQFTPGCP